MPPINTAIITPGSGTVTFPDNASTTGITSSTDSSPATIITADNAINSVSVANLGIGAGLFAGIGGGSNVVISLKSLIVGSGLSIEYDVETITLTSTASAISTTGVTAGIYTNPTIAVDQYGRITAATSRVIIDSVTGGVGLGSGSPIFAGLSNSQLTFNSITAGPGITVALVNNTLTIAAIPVAAVTSVTVLGSSDISVSGLPITTRGIYQLSLAATGVTAGSYSFTSLTVDAKGRITQIATNTLAALVGSVTSTTLGTGLSLISGTTGGGNTSVPATVSLKTIAGGGSIAVTTDGNTITVSAASSVAVTRVDAVSGTGIVVSGGPITATGTLSIGLAASGAVAGTYTLPTMVIDATGRVMSAASNTTVGTVQSVGLTASSGIAVTGAVSPITSKGAFNIALMATGVSAGSYNTASVVVDAYGRVTQAVSTSVVTSINGVGLNGITVTGGPITGTGTLSVSLTPSGVTAGTYTLPNLTVDSYGRVTAITNGAASSVTSVAIANTGGLVVSGGPIVTSGTLSVGLANSGVTAGTYALASITIDAFGRVTSAANGIPQTTIQNIAPKTTGSNYAYVYSGSSGAAAMLSPLTGTTDILVSNAAAPNNTDITVALSTTGVVAGTYGKVTVDAKGRVQFGAPLSSGDVVAALGYTPAQSGSTQSGGSSSGLGNSGVAAGTYTAATIVVNAQGIITSATSLANIPATYTLTVAYDGSGNLAATNTITGLPAGWTYTRDGDNQFTITHNLAKAPMDVTFYSPNNGVFAMKLPNGNPPSQFSLGLTSTTLSSSNSFTVYGVNTSATNAVVNSYSIVQVLI